MRPAIAVLFVTAVLMSLGCSEFDRLRIRAHLGGADSQLLVGYACETGEGTRKDPVAAVKWYRKAAEQGHPKAYGMLGEKYRLGLGVRRDLIQANMFFTLASRHGESHLADRIRAVEKELGDARVAESRRLADVWEANH